MATTALCAPGTITTGRRSVRLFAAFVLLTLSATACGATESTVTFDETAETQSGATESVASDSAGTVAANDADESSQGNTDPDTDGYGAEPVLQTFRLSADAIRWSGNPYGIDHTFTEIDDDDNDLSYISIGGDDGPRATFLRTPDRMEICVENSNACGAGDPTALSSFLGSLPKNLFGSYAPYQFDDGPRIAGGILLGESVGWDISDPDFVFDGRPGRCYSSLGSYQWTGDPEPTETAFPVGDVACVIFYQTSSEMLVSYDFGGDGSLEIETIRVSNTYDEGDLARPAYAPATPDQAGLDAILGDMDAATQSGVDYSLLAG